MNCFAREFSCRIDRVVSKDIELWLNWLKISSRTKNNTGARPNNYFVLIVRAPRTPPLDCARSHLEGLYRSRRRVTAVGTEADSRLFCEQDVTEGLHFRGAFAGRIGVEFAHEKVVANQPADAGDALQCANFELCSFR